MVRGRGRPPGKSVVLSPPVKPATDNIDTAKAVSAIVPNPAPNPAPNSAAPTSDVPPTTAQKESVTVNPNILLNLKQVREVVSAKYGREYPKLTYQFPSQITDGCVVDFVDPQVGSTIGSARLRVRNAAVVDSNGNMLVLTSFSDLSFIKDSPNPSVIV
jgi:hypothetical protein